MCTVNELNHVRLIERLINFLATSSIICYLVTIMPDVFRVTYAPVHIRVSYTKRQRLHNSAEWIPRVTKLDV